MAFMQPTYGVNPYYQQPQFQTQQPIQQQYPSLYGKIVDCYETAKGQDIPIGVNGIYPKADGSAIFFKHWLPEGTTQTDEYIRVVEEKEQQSITNINEALTDIYDSITSLNKKVDSIISPKSSPSQRRKKEVVDDE